MNNSTWRVAWYRFSRTAPRRRGSYLSVLVLIAMLGGVSMASIAAARRTQSSYPTFLASTNPSNLTMLVYNSESGEPPGSNLTPLIDRLPGVRRVRSLYATPLIAFTAAGMPRLNSVGFVEAGGSLDGALVAQDRIAITSGRSSDASVANQVVITPGAARILGVGVGQSLPLGMYTPAQESAPGFSIARVKPALLVRTTVVGIGVLNSQVVQDDVDAAYGFIIVTPTLLRDVLRLLPPLGPAQFDVQLTGRDANVALVERDFIAAAPRYDTTEFHVTSQVVSEVELAIKPESVALGAFGAIAGLACLVLAWQAIARLLDAGSEERQVMRALGARPRSDLLGGLIGVFGSVTLGSILAAGVAVALSPLAPLGPVRALYPDKGFDVDWTVVAIGMAAIVVGLSTAAWARSVINAPERKAGRPPAVPRRSTVVRGAQAAGVPVAGVVGIRFALEPGAGRSLAPVRSALVGTALAVALVVATLTFASGLGTLVSHPRLYGWNWNYALNASMNVPRSALTLLDHDPEVAAWSGYDYTDIQIDGQTVPILLTNAHPRVAPPILSGHDLTGNGQIVLGAATMSLLHKRVGDSVYASYGTANDLPFYIPPTKLRIVGTATLPAVGYETFFAQHPSMGTGAIVPNGVIPAAMQRAMQSPDPNLNGPNIVFVQLRRDVSPSAGRTNLQRISTATNKRLAADEYASGDSVSVLEVSRPAQIVNYRSMGATPVILAGGLALGAIVALGLTLVSSVHSRRRDLAMLKALGFARRQLAAAISWQATVDAVVGIVIGSPVGIVTGRELWTVFARSINAVPDATVPTLSVVLVGVGALIFANAAAALPGRSAARTPAALALRSE